jgi:hypothetical protein
MERINFRGYEETDRRSPAISNDADTAGMGTG